ncbi:MAG: HutD family protein [Oligoflexia bacterium]|nr:HutD family protein [Oligoflexia bacterium]
MTCSPIALPFGEVSVLSQADYRRATWKNGLGHTDQIGIFPQDAQLQRGDFLWRLSSARIEQAAPFSLFPQHDRFLVILRGAGVRLTHCFDETAEEPVEVRRYAPYEFPGDVPSRCELLDGPVTDFSVFIRKGEAEAAVEMVTLAPGETFVWTPERRWNFIFAAEGGFEAFVPGSEKALRVPEGDTLRAEFREAAREPLRLVSRGGAPAQLLVIGLQPAE